MKLKLVKIFFSIKGIFITLFRLKREETYKPMAVDEPKDYDVKYYYRGNREFCIVKNASIPNIGGCFTDTKIRKYDFWEIGVLNFK